MDRDRSNSLMKQEFRQVASSVKQLGTHAATAAREWINERKENMANRNQNNNQGPQGHNRRENGDDQNASRGYQGGTFGQSEYKQSEYNQNESLRGYGEGSSQGAQGTYGVHQRDEGDWANRERGYGQASTQGAQGSQTYGQQSSSQSEYGREQSGRQSGQHGSQSQGRSEYGNQSYGQSQGSSGISQGYGQQRGSGSTEQTYGQSSMGSGYGQSGGQGQSTYSQTSSYGASQGSGQHGFGQGLNRGNEAGSSMSGYGSSAGQSTGASLHRGKGPKGYIRSDERIQEDLNERLFHDDEIDASEVEINVKDGVVTLNGTIEERRLKYRIEDLAESCSGVKDVTNNLRVKSSSSSMSFSSHTGSSTGTTGQSSGSLGGSDTGVDKDGSGKSSTSGNRGNVT